jgi:hypothetical protein
MARKRTLDSEDRCEMVERRKTRGERTTKADAATLVPWLGATEKFDVF